MAVPSNRSPSPLSSRPNTHSRNSESNSTMRRSFSGNPFPRPSVLTNPRSFNPVTPANSPAGFGRRNSLGKDGMGQLQCGDEKENEKDQSLKQMKVRSPANGSKNFMSPTISAASKFTPSPRKKPLVERNEPVRTSISLLDGKATFFSAISSENAEDLVPKSELLAEPKKGEVNLVSTVTDMDPKEAVHECLPASKTVKRVTFAELPSEKTSGLVSETVTIDSDCLNVESDSINMPSCFSEPPVIPPLDADPSTQPYDPKTNYLSPRPQFLHYKPNPRIEVLLSSKEEGLESEVKRLKDSFTLESSSETLSDTDSTEESNSEDSPKDPEDPISAETEEPEVKDAEELPISESSVFTTTVTPETSEQEKPPLSENLDIHTPISCDIPQKIVARKGRFFASLKFLSLFLVFLIGVVSISVTISPAMLVKLSVLEPLYFSELHLPPGVADTAKANFDVFTGRVKQLSSDSFSHLSLLFKNLGGHDKLSPLQFINLTDLQKDILVGGHYHAPESPLVISPTSHEVPEDVNGGKESEKFIENEDLVNEEYGESLQFEEETYVDAVPDDTIETESIGETGMGTQELSISEPEPQMVDIVPDDSIETERQGETSLGTQELTSTSEPAPPQMEEPEAYIDAVPGDTIETEPQGEADLGTQESTSNSELVPQMENPQSMDLEKIWSQEKVASHAEEYVDPPSEIPEVKSEEIAPEIQPELLETIDLGSEAKVESSSVVDINLENNADITSLSAEHETMESPVGESENMHSRYHLGGLASIVLAIISAAAYVYLQKPLTNNKPNPVVQSKKIIPKSSVSDLDQMQQEKQQPSSQNWPTEDVMEESCPSEVSSFQTSSTHSKFRNGANETQSQERSLKPRKKHHSKRESLASSSECSMDSPSYGSFTTYEKIPSKHAGDDEIVTPVRRSSRIKNLVTS